MCIKPRRSDMICSASHLSSQGNDRRSADVAANNGRRLQHGTLSLWLCSVYKCAIRQGGQVFPGLRAFNAPNPDCIRSAHTQGSPQGIKRVARPHHHVEPDVHESCTMQISTSKVHWVGAECNDHALISCTVGGDLLTYRKGQLVGGRPGELNEKKIDPKQLPRIRPKLHVITSPIA